MNDYGYEYGSINGPCTFLKATLWDSEGNEIKVPEGHSVVVGRESFAVVDLRNDNDDGECKVVYTEHIKKEVRQETQPEG